MLVLSYDHNVYTVKVLIFVDTIFHGIKETSMVLGFLNSCLTFFFWPLYCLLSFDLCLLLSLWCLQTFLHACKKKTFLYFVWCYISCFQWTTKFMKIGTPRIIIRSQCINSFRFISSLLSVVCMRAHILFTLFVFVSE